MKEEYSILGGKPYGARIYPSLDKDEPIGHEGYIEVFFSTSFLNSEDRQKVRINISYPNGMMSIEQTRQLIDALERGMQILAQDHHDKLKRELDEMRKKVILEEK